MVTFLFLWLIGTLLLCVAACLQMPQTQIPIFFSKETIVLSSSWFCCRLPLTICSSKKNVSRGNMWYPRLSLLNRDHAYPHWHFHEVYKPLSCFSSCHRGQMIWTLAEMLCSCQKLWSYEDIDASLPQSFQAASSSSIESASTIYLAVAMY